MLRRLHLRCIRKSSRLTVCLRSRNTKDSCCILGSQDLLLIYRLLPPWIVHLLYLYPQHHNRIVIPQAHRQDNYINYTVSHEIQGNDNIRASQPVFALPISLQRVSKNMFELFHLVCDTLIPFRVLHILHNDFE